MEKFNEWVVLRENQEGTLWERHKELPSIFKRTYYALPTSQQLEEFQQYPDLSADDICQGFGYTIVGRGVRSLDSNQKIVESIRRLVERYPDREAYKEALVKAKKESKIKIDGVCSVKARTSACEAEREGSSSLQTP